MKLNFIYRKEIDGLRAISVIAVLIYHSGLGVLPSGYLGVDIFFVISGYLIAEILLAEICQKTFSYVNFYERRARRILPALITVIIISLLAACIILLPRDLKRFSDSLISTPIFLSNLYFYLTTNYFDANSDLKPLLHTWSIALEWQFYLFLPPIFIWLNEKFSKKIISFLLIIIAASLFWESYSQNFSGSFYFLPARIWEFLVGSLIAVVRPRMMLLLNSNISAILSFIGIALIIYSFTLDYRDQKIMSLIRFMPILGTIFVLMYFKSDFAFSKILTNRLIVLIGLLSYSIYLCHQPIFAFLRRFDFYYINSEICIFLATIFIFIISFALWRYVETPFRNKSVVPKKLFLKLSFVSIFIIMCAGFFVRVSNGFPERLPPVARQYLIAEEYERVLLKTGCNLKDDYINFSDCRRGFEKNPKFALIGDSHAQAIVSELSNAFNSSQESFLPLTMRSCPFGGGGEDLQSTAVCARYQNAVSNALHNQDIEYVIILSRWDNGVDGIYYSYKTYSSQFDAISKLLLMGKRVIFIQPYPAYTVPIGDHLATQLWRSGTLSKGPLIRRSEYLERISLEADLIKDFINNPNFIYIATQDIFCGEGQNGVCVYHEHGSPLYSDESHLTNLGALKIVNKIMKIPILKSN